MSHFDAGRAAWLHLSAGLMPWLHLSAGPMAQLYLNAVRAGAVISAVKVQIVFVFLLALTAYFMIKLVASAKKIPARGLSGRGCAIREHKKYAAGAMYSITGLIGIVESIRIAGLLRVQGGLLLDLHLAFAFGFTACFFAAGWYNGIWFPARHVNLGRIAYKLFAVVAALGLILLVRM